MSKKSQSKQARGVRICRKKIKYNCENEAMIAIEKYEQNHKRTSFDFYKCGDHFHITTSPKSQYTRLVNAGWLDSEYMMMQIFFVKVKNINEGVLHQNSVLSKLKNV